MPSAAGVPRFLLVDSERTAKKLPEVIRLPYAGTCACGEHVAEGERVGYLWTRAQVVCLYCMARLQARRIDPAQARRGSPSSPWPTSPSGRARPPESPHPPTGWALFPGSPQPVAMSATQFPSDERLLQRRWRDCSLAPTTHHGPDAEDEHPDEEEPQGEVERSEDPADPSQD